MISKALPLKFELDKNGELLCAGKACQKQSDHSQAKVRFKVFSLKKEINLKFEVKFTIDLKKFTCVFNLFISFCVAYFRKVVLLLVGLDNSGKTATAKGLLKGLHP